MYVEPNRLPNGPGVLRVISGKLYDVLAEDVPVMTLGEVAHSLSMQCRYIGHIPVFRSVALHSVHVAGIIELSGGSVEEQLTGLLHDVPEAYIGDMPYPLKAVPEFAAIFNAHDERISSKVIPAFGGIWPLPQIVVDADRNSYLWELENVRTGIWNSEGQDDAPGMHKQTFIDRYNELTERIKNEVHRLGA